MRSTDLTKIIFPVALRDIFYEEPLGEGTLKVPIKAWKAMVDVDQRHTFSVVSNDYREMGENAYAVYNAASDYASAPPRTGSANLINGMQKRVGNWLEEFASEQQPLNFGEYLSEQSAYFSQQEQRLNS